jgi:hypothetical protein
MERLRRLNPALSGGLHVVSFLQPTHQLELPATVDPLRPRRSRHAALQGMRVRFPPSVIEVQGRSDDTLILGAPGARAVCVLPLALSTNAL